MARVFYSLLAAFQFLTVVSLPWRRREQAAQLGNSAGFFPLAGAFIGGVLVGANYLFDLGLPPAVTRALLLVIAVVLTGGLHLDGLGDTCDGLGGYKSVAQRHHIMRDSRIGGYGVIGIVLLLLVKYVALIHIPDNLMVGSLLLMPVAGRAAMTYAIYAFPYARSRGLGTELKRGTNWLQLSLAILIAAAVAALTMRLVGMVILLATGIIALLLGLALKRIFAGLTGDNYGAVNEITEAVALILIIVAVQLGFLEAGG